MHTRAVALALSITYASATALKSKSRFSVLFGPQDCVRLSQSASGSCIISTDCEGLDTSKFEFAFDCVKPSETVRHSYGIGGFDSYEEFDSGVQCARCEPPGRPASASRVAKATSKAPKIEHDLPVPKQLAPHAKQESISESHDPVPGVVEFKTKLRAKRAKHHHKNRFWPFTSGETEPKVTKYGPKDCVSTWRNDKGECVIKTDCGEVDISDYRLGLKCVDEKGDAVVHDFGDDSFGRHEEFDTLIPCHECLGLPIVSVKHKPGKDGDHGVGIEVESGMPNVTVEPEKKKDKKKTDKMTTREKVAVVHKEINSLTGTIKNLMTNLDKLNAAVLKKKAPAPAPAPSAAPETSSLLSVQEAERTAALLEKDAEGDDDHDGMGKDNEFDEEQDEAGAKKADSAEKAGKSKESEKEDDDDDDSEDNEFDADKEGDAKKADSAEKAGKSKESEKEDDDDDDSDDN